MTLDFTAYLDRFLACNVMQSQRIGICDKSIKFGIREKEKEK